MKEIAFFFIIASGILFSCDSKEDCCTNTPKTYLRSWLLVESGYSIGGPEIVVPVDPAPAQILTLEDNGELSSTMNGLNSYKYFKFIAGAGTQDVIMFYKTKSDRESSINEIPYTIVFAEDFLTLGYHNCIEGCHLGFVPIK